MADLSSFRPAATVSTLAPTGQDQSEASLLSRRLFLTGACAAVAIGSAVLTAPAAFARTADTGGDTVDTGGDTADHTSSIDDGESNSTDSLSGDRGPRSIRRALDFLRIASNAYPMSNPGPRLAQSYADQLGLFSTAFVYDNALAICAALAGGTQYEDLARTLGDGVVYAVDHDPVHTDGRLRQAYNVGPYTFYDGNPQPYGFVMPDGTANIGGQFGFTGTAVGDMAWPGIALVHLHHHTADERYLETATRIGQWIIANAYSDKALGGFCLGVNGDNVPLPNVSTEHNIDCVSFFGMLASVTGDRSWTQARDHARGFIERMWEPTKGSFYAGSNDGITINPDPLPLDPQTWSWLALRDKRYARALEWAGSALRVIDDPSAPNSQLPDGTTIAGVTFSSASETSTAQYNGSTVNPGGVWLEGTGQLATSLTDRNRGGDRAKARRLMCQIHTAQSKVGSGQTLGHTALAADGGVVAASSLIDTGFGFGYFQVQHVGATSWYVMAAEKCNPMQHGGLHE